MTFNEFTTLASTYNIEPTIALENDNVVSLLRDIKNTSCNNAKNGYRNILISVLENEF